MNQQIRASAKTLMGPHVDIQEMTSSKLDDKASNLVRLLAKDCNREYGLGSMSSAIYDTAWVAMTSKTHAGETHWLFPESFRVLLDNQTCEGGWGSGASEVDNILSTLAALLALKRHAPPGLCVQDITPADIEARIAKATAFLATRLMQWDVEASVHVGFEILVPSLLVLLEQERPAVSFEFEERPLLMKLNAKKMAAFDSRMLYGRKKTTLLHSLEAFIGKIDFDRVRHHSTFGSMLASPSSTSAYLMHCTVWDEEAEAYLRDVIENGAGKGCGSVPSAFPSTIFEISWVTSTLLESGFAIQSLGQERLHQLADYLEARLQDQNGLVGFAPALLADADDTAKAIFTLNLLGRPSFPDRLIAEFETDAHFRTYKTERNASFSANCNVLKCLLYMPDPNTYANQIAKTVEFLCESCENGTAKDKWNLSTEYTMMLLTQALMRLLYLWDGGQLRTLSGSIVRDRIPVVLLQVLMRNLQGQHPDGTWGLDHSCEVTAYAVITLVTISSLPFVHNLKPQINLAVSAGRQILDESNEDWAKGAFVWVEKVTYSSALLSQSYCLAAMKISPTRRQWGESVKSLTTIPQKAIAKFSSFYSQLPLFSKEPEWRLQASLIQSYLFLPRLRHIRLDIFPRQEMEEDKYLEYIPFTWTGSNNLAGNPQSANLLWEMMKISMLNYQADEYMEAVVGKHFGHDLESVRERIHRLCEKPIAKPQSDSKKRSQPDDGFEELGRSLPTPPERRMGEDANTIQDIEKTLGRFTEYVLKHPKVQKASSYDQENVRRELQTFLLAHVTHSADNALFARQNPSPNKTLAFEDCNSTYYAWVHTTSADHTSCPYSFAFFTCLISNDDASDTFIGPRPKYLAADLCRHLATMCRQYNDYGSLARDRAERNLNSVNFPEFHQAGEQDLMVESDIQNREAARKKELLQLAEYERECLELAMRRLEEVVGAKVMDALRLFVRVTDLYGQIYVARDIASRMG